MLLFVSVVIATMATVFIVLAPKQSAEREMEHSTTAASLTVDLLRMVLEDEIGEADSLGLHRTMGVARDTPELTYVVVTDELGKTLGAINEAGAIRLGFNLPEGVQSYYDEGYVIRRSASFPIDDSSTGRLYVGISTAAAQKQAKSDRTLFICIALLLYVLAGSILMTIQRVQKMEGRVSIIKKMHRELSAEKSILESRVLDQEKSENELKESEQRYRFLLENAMESTFKDLERQKEALEKEVAEKTIYEQKLIKERDRAEEMARLKTAFLANMSHEIRTPLSGIIGFAQVLDEELDDERREFTGLIQQSAKRLLDTINSVLHLSKLEANKQSFEMRKLNVSEVVNNSVRMLEPLAKAKGLDLSTELGTEQFFRLDQPALESIVNNLVGNAIKFTDQGHITIRVQQEGEHLRIQVEDSGVGISNTFLPILFDEFRQEHMGADRPHEGSGLGLAITSRLVDRMGGKIEVESTLGKGTCFTITFSPKSTQKDRAPKHTRSASSKSAVSA